MKQVTIMAQLAITIECEDNEAELIQAFFESYSLNSNCDNINIVDYEKLEHKVTNEIFWKIQLGNKIAQ